MVEDDSMIPSSEPSTSILTKFGRIPAISQARSRVTESTSIIVPRPGFWDSVKVDPIVPSDAKANVPHLSDIAVRTGTTLESECKAIFLTKYSWAVGSGSNANTFPDGPTD